MSWSVPPKLFMLITKTDYNKQIRIVWKNFFIPMSRKVALLFYFVYVLLAWRLKKCFDKNITRDKVDKFHQEIWHQRTVSPKLFVNLWAKSFLWKHIHPWPDPTCILHDNVYMRSVFKWCNDSIGSIWSSMHTLYCFDFWSTNVSYAQGAHCLLCSSNHLHQMFNYTIIPIFIFKAQQTHILLLLW